MVIAVALSPVVPETAIPETVMVTAVTRAPGLRLVAIIPVVRQGLSAGTYMVVAEPTMAEGAPTVLPAAPAAALEALADTAAADACIAVPEARVAADAVQTRAAATARAAAAAPAVVAVAVAAADIIANQPTRS